jgi:c-di-GMP-binding flagellar brake protein YcgR
MPGSISIDPFDRRCSLRTIIDEYYTIEFSFEDDTEKRQYLIRDISSSGMCFVAEKNSEIFSRIKAGDVLELKYYPTSAKQPVRPARVKIAHITEDESGRFGDCLMVGISVLEKPTVDPASEDAVGDSVPSET